MKLLMLILCSMQLVSMLRTCRHTSVVCHAHTSVAGTLTTVFSLLAMVRRVLPPSAWRRSPTGSSRTLGVRTGVRMDTTRSAGAPTSATSAVSTPWSPRCPPSTPLRRSRLICSPPSRFHNGRTTIPANIYAPICVLLYIRQQRCEAAMGCLLKGLCLVWDACYKLFGCSKVITRSVYAF